MSADPYFADAEEADERLDALRMREPYPPRSEDLATWGVLPSEWNPPIFGRHYACPDGTSAGSRLQGIIIHHEIACFDCRYERWCPLHERLLSVVRFLQERDTPRKVRVRGRDVRIMHGLGRPGKQRHLKLRIVTPDFSSLLIEAT